MKKIIIGIAVLLLSLLLFGCSSGTTPNTGNIYVGGTRGLELSFITPFGDDKTGKDIVYMTNSNPPVSDGFDMAVNVKNEGEADVAAGNLKLKLIGINEQEFNNIVSGMEIQNSKPFAKIEKGVTYFDEQDLSFAKTGKIQFNRNIVAEDPKTVTVYACYLYNTIMSSSICFTTSKNGMTNCNNLGDKDFSVSGAPIQVTKVTQSPSSSKVNVNIEIKNVGSGDVYEQVTPAKTCNFDQDNRDAQNKVIATVISKGTDNKPNLNCGDGVVRLVNGVGELRCSRDIGDTDSYSEQVTIQLDYQYQQTSAHPFSIYAYGNTVDVSTK